MEVGIAKVRVSGVQEIKIIAKGSLPEKTVIASTLLIEPLEKSDDPRLDCHGTITVPVELPFGRRFILTLCDPDKQAQPSFRQFKDE